MICAVADVCIHTRKWTHRPTNSLSSLAEMQMLPGAWNTGVCRAFALTTHMEGTGITSSSPVGSRVLLAAFVRLCTFFLLTRWWFKKSWVIYIALVQKNPDTTQWTWWPGAHLLLSYGSIPKAWCYSHQYVLDSALCRHPKPCGSSMRHWEMSSIPG